MNKPVLIALAAASERVLAYGTIGVFFYALQTGEKNYALTLAFTTFVLLQC